MNNLLERLGTLTHKQLMLLAFDQQRQLEAANRRRPEAIAVVGVGCRFPGGGDGPQAFWDLLREGRDAIREVPSDRWDIDSFYDADPDAAARMAVRSGGFLDDVGGFDAAFFGISPREAIAMDPQQRLLLEVVWEALEHANVAADQLIGSATGVFVGLCNSDHFQRLLRRGNAAIDAYLASGNAPSVAAGRIAYCLGLRGPALTVDTSCSASLVSIHLACQSLRSGESRLALAGGANVICAPETMIALSKAHMLAPDGRCKTFDAAADGFSRGEGCGVLVLKQLSDALSDGDTVHAVIRGTAVNQDGRSGGLTVPNGAAQESVIRAALDAAGASPNEIDYVEAHGTGTSLGDPIEMRALSATLGAHRPRGAPLLVGSVKTNIGHQEAAAGVAGVIKVVLALEHGSIPPHLHFQHPSAHIPWDEYNVEVTSAEHPWPPGPRARIAGVSSFGFSGTNAHAIIEEAPRTHRKISPAEPRTFHCLPLSARSETALAKLASRYGQALSTRPDLTLADVVHTAGAGRSHLPRRLAVVANTMETAVDALQAFAVGGSHPALHSGAVAPAARHEVVFVFPGRESAYPGMGRRLYDASSAYREAVDQCDRIVGPDASGRTLKSILWDRPNEDTLSDERVRSRLILFTAQYAAVQLWKSFGVEPAAAIGDRDGEYAAACVAGVFSIEDALRVVAGQGTPGVRPVAGRAAVLAFRSHGRAAARIEPACRLRRLPILGEPWVRAGRLCRWRQAIATGGLYQLPRGQPESGPERRGAAAPAGGWRIASNVSGSWRGRMELDRPLSCRTLCRAARRSTGPRWPRAPANVRFPPIRSNVASYWYSPAQLEDLSVANSTRSFWRSPDRGAVGRRRDVGRRGASRGAVLSGRVAEGAAAGARRAVAHGPGTVCPDGSRTVRRARLRARPCRSMIDCCRSWIGCLRPILPTRCVSLASSRRIGRVFAVEQEAARLRIAPRHSRLFKRLARIACRRRRRAPTRDVA